MNTLSKTSSTMLFMILALSTKSQNDSLINTDQKVYENKQIKMVVINKKAPKDSTSKPDHSILIENEDGSKEEVILRRKSGSKGLEVVVVSSEKDTSVRRDINPEEIKVSWETNDDASWNIDSGKSSKKELEKEEKTRVTWNGFDIGLNNWIQENGSFDLSEDYRDMRPSNARSLNFAWNVVQAGVALGTQHLWLVSGAGIEYNNYRFDADIDLKRGGDILTYAPADKKYIKNKLVSQYISVPLGIQFTSNPGDDEQTFKIETGVQFGYLMGSHQKTKWNDGRRQKSKIRGDYHLSDTRMGVYARLGYGDFSMYAKYYPTPAFKGGRGPEGNTVAIGLSINAF